MDICIIDFTYALSIRLVFSLKILPFRLQEFSLGWAASLAFKNLVKMPAFHFRVPGFND